MTRVTWHATQIVESYGLGNRFATHWEVCLEWEGGRRNWISDDIADDIKRWIETQYGAPYGELPTMWVTSMEELEAPERYEVSPILICFGGSVCFYDYDIAMLFYLSFKR